MSDTSPSRALVAVPLGLVFGAVLGVLARGWMRVISTDPEFSREGTIFIVGVFTLWGLAQGTVVAVRRATSRRWLVSLTRVFGLVGTVPLFSGAGLIMGPTVIAGGLARHRTDWKKWIRYLAGLVGSLPVLVVGVQLHGDWGWTWKWWVGMTGLVVIYGTVIRAGRGTMAPQNDGWRHSRHPSPNYWARPLLIGFECGTLRRRVFLRGTQRWSFL